MISLSAVRRSASAIGRVPEDERRQALATAYVKNAESCLWRGRYRDAFALARKAWALEPDARLRRRLLAL